MSPDGFAYIISQHVARAMLAVPSLKTKRVRYLAHSETLKHRPCRSHGVNVTMPWSLILEALFCDCRFLDEAHSPRSSSEDRREYNTNPFLAYPVNAHDRYM